jgi:hypothetical protein
LSAQEVDTFTSAPLRDFRADSVNETEYEKEIDA